MFESFGLIIFCRIPTRVELGLSRLVRPHIPSSHSANTGKSEGRPPPGHNVCQSLPVLNLT